PLGDLAHRMRAPVADRDPFHLAAILKPEQSPMYADLDDPNAYRFLNNDSANRIDLDGRISILLLICSGPLINPCSAALVCSLNVAACSWALFCSANAAACSASVFACSANAAA